MDLLLGVSRRDLSARFGSTYTGWDLRRAFKLLQGPCCFKMASRISRECISRWCHVPGAPVVVSGASPGRCADGRTVKDKREG